MKDTLALWCVCTVKVSILEPMHSCHCTDEEGCGCVVMVSSLMEWCACARVCVAVSTGSDLSSSLMVSEPDDDAARSGFTLNISGTPAAEVHDVLMPVYFEASCVFRGCVWGWVRREVFVLNTSV